jgi:Sec23/Sec24 trunk domain
VFLCSDLLIFTLCLSVLCGASTACNEEFSQALSSYSNLLSKKIHAHTHTFIHTFIYICIYIYIYANTSFSWHEEVSQTETEHLIAYHLITHPHITQHLTVNTCTGPALNAAKNVIQHIGGKILLFQSSLPSIGTYVLTSCVLVFVHHVYVVALYSQCSVALINRIKHVTAKISSMNFTRKHQSLTSLSLDYSKILSLQKILPFWTHTHTFIPVSSFHPNKSLFSCNPLSFYPNIEFWRRGITEESWQRTYARYRQGTHLTERWRPVSTTLLATPLFMSLFLLLSFSHPYFSPPSLSLFLSTTHTYSADTWLHLYT